MFKSVFITIGVFTSIFLMMFISLVNGISINNIASDSLNVKGLYLKYDKKLIFSIEKLEIYPSDESSEGSFNPLYVHYFNTALSYFKSIELKDIVFQKEHISLLYKNNIFTVTSNNVELTLTQSIINDTLEYKASTNKIKDIKFLNKFATFSDATKELINKQFTFDYIQLEELSGKEKISLLNNFNFNSLYTKLIIQNPQLKYNEMPTVSLKNIIVELSQGNIDVSINKSSHPQHLTAQGSVKTTLENKNTAINARLYYKDLEIDTNNTIEKQTLSYQLSTNKFKDIKIFEEFITIPAGIRKWAVVRLTPELVQINNVSGKVDLETSSVDFSSLRVDADLHNIIMDFNPKKAYPLEASKVFVFFDGKDMNIKLDNPKSNDVDLKGSDAVIYDMFGDSGLLLRLQSISPLNWTLVRVVKSYGVNIADDLGVRQTKGTSDIKVKIDIPFGDDPTDVYVKILNQNSTINIKENPIDFKNFDFLYKDKKVILKDTHIEKENNNIIIDNLLFDITQNSLNTSINAYDTNKMFSLNLTNSTSLNDKIASGIIKLDFVDIKDVIDVKNYDIPYNVTFKKDVIAQIPTFDILFTQTSEINKLEIKDIKKFEALLLPLAKANIKNGSIIIDTKDFNTIQSTINLQSNTNNDTLLFDTLLSSTTNLEDKTSNSNLHLTKLVIDGAVDINNTTIPINVDFKDPILVDFPSLDIHYKKEKDNNTIKISSFEKLSALIKAMQNKTIPKGDLSLCTKDFKNIDAKLNIATHPIKVFYKKEELYKLTLNANIKDMKYIDIKDSKNMIEATINLESKQPIIDITTNNLGIYYKVEDTNATKEEPKKESKKEPLKKCENIVLSLPTIKTSFNNGYLKYNKNLLEYNNIRTYMKEDKVLFSFASKKTNLDLFLDKENIDLTANYIDSDFINALLGKKALDGGKIYLTIKGSQCQIEGKTYLRKVNIKDAAILNNIFLAVNSAPALINPLLILPNAVRFASDKFSLSEYEVRDGHIDFTLDRNKSILDIKNADIKGVHSSFKGDINIDLYNEKIKSKLDIIFMKDYAKIIDYIPVVNYLLLGDERNFSYTANIDGNFTNPKVTTHMTKETLMAPVNIIKRVFLLPTLPFRDSNTSNSKKK